MKLDYIDKLTRAYTSLCECGHVADVHAHNNGYSHAGQTSTGACACVLSVSQAALISQFDTIATKTAEIERLRAALEYVRDYDCSGSIALDNVRDVARESLKPQETESK